MVGLVLLLLARPISVALSLIGFRVPWREQAFVSWAGLRGAVPIVLATFPFVEGVEGSDRLLNIVFVLVVVFTLVQGPSLQPLARWLRLTGDPTREIEVEAAPLDVLGAELLTMTVHPPSRLRNVSMLELRLPDPSRHHADHPCAGMRSCRSPRRASRPATNCSSSPPPRRATRPNAGCGRSAGEAKLAHWFDEYGEQD